MSANRFALGLHKICCRCVRIQLQHGLLETTQPIALGVAPTRSMSNKHWDPKWRKLRAKKVIKIDLPDYDKVRRESNMSPEEQRAFFKKEGIQPPRHHEERDLVLASTNVIFEAYVPPEGDGVASIISGKGAKQRLTELEKKGKSMMQLRKIKQFEPFDSIEFADEALKIYLEVHDLLQDIKTNENRLHDLVTEKAYPEMVWKLNKKTFLWKYVEALEPPRTVHVRTVDMLSKENLYAQVTVRLHSKQILAIYDRFGRLVYGSGNLIKDALEYVVFEKHISDENSRWRIHGKIIPDWMPARQPILRTMKMPNFQPIEDVDESEDSGSNKEKSAASSA